MIDVTTMKLTRKRVLRGVRELSRRQKRVTYEEIAAYAECSAKTVMRAVNELEADGQLRRLSGGQGFGYQYEVIKNADAR